MADQPESDIENQKLFPFPSSSSATQISAAPPTVGNQVNDGANTRDEIAPNIAATIFSYSNSGDTDADIWMKISFIFLILLMIPFVLAYVYVCVCLHSEILDPDEFFSGNKGKKRLESSRSKKGIYKKMYDFSSTKEKVKFYLITISVRAGFLALSWLVLNLCIPSLKRVIFIDCPLWKWSLLVAIVLTGYFSTYMVTVMIESLIWKCNVFMNQPKSLYFVDGLEESIASLLYVALILLVWLFYFRTDEGLHLPERVEQFGTWSLVSLLVGAVLWVIKSVMLLSWKAKAVHRRFQGRILTAGFQLYFLSLIINDIKTDKLLPWRYNTKITKPIFDKYCTTTAGDSTKTPRIEDYILSKLVPIDEIAAVAKYVTDLAKVTLREDDGISEIIAKCQHKIPAHDGNTVQYITKQDLCDLFGLDESDALLLLWKLKGDLVSEKVTYDAFQRWVIDAHQKCLSVGYTLIDGFAVVSVLNRVIVGLVAVVVVLLWLLVTGHGTTNVLVLVASPFLAISFIFGDTCKTFFQGIMFSFVTHPYDIGDRCVIEGGVELEVKRIAIFTTTFVRIGTEEKVIYPNTSLATKFITNLQGEPDPSDIIELNLDSSTTKLQIMGLKKDLESFFENNDRHGSYEKSVHVAVKEIGSSIKVIISFTHVMNVQDVTHSQCFKKKNKQRSELLIEIRQFLEDQEIKLASTTVEAKATPK